jgi:hypothetical protein
LIIAGAALLILAALLWLDLANRGLAWRVFWSLTGEETPAGQLRGMVEWGGNLIRTPPRTAPSVPVDHAGVNPYGINTFLEQEVELEKRALQLEMISEAGFTWIRQQFPWEDIEIHGRGDFIDRRNDPNGIDAWAKYDHIVGLAEQYGIRIQARLDNPPAWSHADPSVGTFAPPDDLQDFVNYAVAVAERYRGRIHHYQVWNEPNIYPEWGEQPVSAVAYTEMLCRTYQALKAVDPDILVITGALAPTVALDGRDLQDYVFLQQMYDAGAGDCFDILSAQGYGLNSGPTDRRLRPTTVNFGRHLYLRDVMVANGDAHKPVWISEAAWNPVAEPGVPRDLVGYANFGTVTLEQAARYMPLAYERVEREMPWIGVVNYWFFKRAADNERRQSFYYFRMVEPDFSPMPIYDAMRNYIALTPPVLYPGVHQAEHWAIFHTRQRLTPAEGAQFERAVETYAVSFTAEGTDLLLRWQGDATLIVVGETAEPLAMVSPQPITDDAAADSWTHSHIPLGQFTTTRPLRITATDDAPFLLDSVGVVDQTAARLTPVIAAGVGLALFMVAVFVSAGWRRLRRR